MRFAWTFRKTSHFVFSGSSAPMRCFVGEGTASAHPAVAVAAAVGRPDAHAGEVPAAYVQLKKGASASEGELVAFLRREIAERAALPKHVTIVDAMPLTAVGKIYKPALKRRATKEALEAALREADVRFRSLEVVDDPTRGMVAKLEIEDAAAHDRAREVLGRFPVPFTVSWSTP